LRGYCAALFLTKGIFCLSNFISFSGFLRGNRNFIHTYGDLASYCAEQGRHAKKLWRLTVQSIAYIYIFGTCTVLLLTMKISLMEMFQQCSDSQPSNNDNTTSCNTTVTCTMSGCTTLGVTDLGDSVWLAVTCGVVFLFVHIRTLKDAGLLSYVGVGTIAIVNVSLSQVSTGTKSYISS
jgi:solute carrier family 36 (proton-coupled amino acid transporter)